MYGIHGKVVDLNTSATVAARVYISGHDKDSSHVYSDTLTGRFTRLISQGIWALTFSSKGYHDTTIDNIFVLDRQKTDLMVAMKPVITAIDTSKRDKPLLYPNPASVFIWAKLPENLSGNFNITIISQSGMKVADFNRDVLFGYPLYIDVKDLSGGGYTIIFTNVHSGRSYKNRFIITGRSF
jgi:hypothetical protein